ncbi:ArsR/SmtB family transcription factor [Cellulosimicrobium cellulans]|uniref:ArsR/SmtB family transcription factor n=1 Tax=Cellulosimicrobium cellulans TaxID=1710 RepID=UPI0008484BE4|nr:helix-turn-helix domain-containing protein [Cellulosimicrobium cellulans]
MGTEDTTPPTRPTENVLGPAQLKALAHPLRIQILDLLASHSALTASGIAQLVGESSGSTSYHLRQLARHGFVQEVPGRGTGRERWWERRPGGFTVGLPDDPQDAAAVATTTTVNREFENVRARKILALLENPQALGREWLEATRLTTTNLWLTVEQMAEVDAAWERLADMFERYGSQERTPGARPVQIHFNLFPLVDGKENPS